MRDDMYKKLGPNIRALRKQNGENQLELVLAIGKEHSQIISQYELGVRVPERDLLLKIAKRYRITENELINGNFSSDKKISDYAINDSKYQKKMFDKIFPFKSSDIAMKNKDFKKAFELHNQLYDDLLKGINLAYDKMKLCRRLYDKAGESGVIEGVVNGLWWLMLLCFFNGIRTPQLVEKMDDFNKKPLDYQKLIKDGYLPSFDDVDWWKAYESLQKEKREFMKAFEEEIVVKIYKLKNSLEYSDLGDYYVALQYMFGVVLNSHSEEMNVAVGEEMMRILSLYGNQYADEFFRF